MRRGRKEAAGRGARRPGNLGNRRPGKTDRNAGGAPAGEDADAGLTLEQAAQRALELTGEGFGPTAAAKAAAQGTPYSKSEVYKQLLVLQQDRQTAE